MAWIQDVTLNPTPITASWVPLHCPGVTREPANASSPSNMMVQVVRPLLPGGALCSGKLQAVVPDTSRTTHERCLCLHEGFFTHGRFCFQG